MSSIARSASTRIDRSMRRLTTAALEAEARRWPGLLERMPDSQLDHVAEDTRYHLRFLSAALWADEEVLFRDYVSWTRVLFEGLGLPMEWLEGSLEDVDLVLQSELTAEEAFEASRFISAGLAAKVERLTDSFGRPTDATSAAALAYLGSILNGDRLEASGVVRGEVRAGVPVQVIYMEVIQPAQLELGRLWHLHRVSVAQEHVASAISRRTMAQLMATAPLCDPAGRTVVAACVGHELHEIGLQMVADFFEMAGWDVHYLGPNTPAEAIVTTASEASADLVALSTAMSWRVPALGQTIASLRADERTRDTPVIVGGCPFNAIPDLWRRVSADGYARDAAEAIIVGEDLVRAKRREDA
jgi:methanogenic corrinoid protein MtbC1